MTQDRELTERKQMKRTWLKYLGYIVGAIILGAIGSGVWAEILSPILNILIDGIVELFSAISTSFTDSIYSEAAKGFHEEYSLMLLLLCLGIGFGVQLGLVASIRIFWRVDKTDFIRDTIHTMFQSNRFFIPLGFMFLVFLVLTSFISIQASYQNKIITNSLNSIEIVAPHIGIQQTLELRSMFHSIQTSDDYKDFYETLKTLEKAFKLKLPVSAPL